MHKRRDFRQMNNMNSIMTNKPIHKKTGGRQMNNMGGKNLKMLII